VNFNFADKKQHFSYNLNQCTTMTTLTLDARLGLGLKISIQQLQHLKLLHVTGLQLEQHILQELADNPMRLSKI